MTAREWDATSCPALGLGLYVARLDVDVMGGTLNVESEEGRGALFVVELPGRLLVNALALSP